MMNRKGFTLLDLLIYLSLFSFMVTSSLLAFYQISESSNMLQSDTFKIKESEFIINKINWLINISDKIIEPEEGDVSNNLILIHDGKTLSVFFSDGQIFLEKDGSTNALSSDEVEFENLSFEKRKTNDDYNLFVLETSFGIGEEIFKNLTTKYE